VPRRTSPATTSREPRAAELRYIAGLRRVWLVVQEIIQTGLDPLFAVWPAEERTDAALPVEVALPGVTAYGRPRRIAGRQYNPGPFGPPLRRRITDLTDADLRRLWPGLDPQDVRSYAPWATSREEVYRISYPAGTEMREGAEGAIDVQGRVRAGIEAERARLRAGTGDPVTVKPHSRPPSSFRIRRPVFTRSGAVMVPPMPSVVSTATIRRQMEWIELATHQVVTTTNLGPIIDPVARQTSLFAQRETERVLALDLRQRVPGLLAQINAWRESNINLIESGIRAPRRGACRADRRPLRGLRLPGRAHRPRPDAQAQRPGVSLAPGPGRSETVPLEYVRRRAGAGRPRGAQRHRPLMGQPAGYRPGRGQQSPGNARTMPLHRRPHPALRRRGI